MWLETTSYIRIIPPDLALLYRYYPQTLEHTLAHLLIIAIEVVFISMFISVTENCIFYSCKFLYQKYKVEFEFFLFFIVLPIWLPDAIR